MGLLAVRGTCLLQNFGLAPQGGDSPFRVGQKWKPPGERMFSVYRPSSELNLRRVGVTLTQLNSVRAIVYFVVAGGAWGYCSSQPEGGVSFYAPYLHRVELLSGRPDAIRFEICSCRQNGRRQCDSWCAKTLDQSAVHVRLPTAFMAPQPNPPLKVGTRRI
jgi:hypothetical protein